jgi:hypothetical protein
VAETGEDSASGSRGYALECRLRYSETGITTHPEERTSWAGAADENKEIQRMQHGKRRRKLNLL